MQAVAICDGLNRGRQIETQIDERDILAVADQYFEWLQQPTTPDEPVKSQPITQESNNAPVTESQKGAMKEYAESLGASVVGEVPEGLEQNWVSYLPVIFATVLLHSPTPKK